MDLFDYKRVCRGSYDPTTDITVHEWFDYNPEDANYSVREVLDSIYDAFCTTKSAKVLVLTKNARGAFSPEIQKYIETVQFPRFASHTNLRFVATVMPDERINVMYTALWKEQLARNDRFIQADFSSEEEAVAWLKQCA